MTPEQQRIEDLEFKVAQLSDAYYKYNFQGSQAITKDTTVQSGFLQSGNFKSGVTGWQIKSNGNAEFQNVNIGTKIITIDNTQDIQTNLDLITTSGGGVLNLKAGTYTVNSAILPPSNTAIQGLNKGTVIIDFNNTSANISYAGTNVYATGTITAITSGVNVTGSGTSWLANVTAGQHLFINTRWYQIASVTSDTTLILAESYGDDETLPITYRIATPAQNIKVADITLKNSTGTALSLTDCRDYELEDLLFLDNNKGLSETNCAYSTKTRLTSVSNTSHGYEIANGSLLNSEYCAAAGNGGDGFHMENIEATPFARCSSNSNTGDGFNCTTLESCAFGVEANGNGSNGIEFVSGCDENFINNSIVNGNTGDGIKLTGTSDANTLGPALNLVGNGGYGINIGATCTNNMVISPYFESNSSGTYVDSGSGTVIIQSTSTLDTTALTASDNLKTSADGVDAPNSSSYEVVKQIMVRYPGIIRVKFDIKAHSGFTMFGIIYKNGIAIGTERSTTGTSYTTFSEDIRVTIGDYIELYTKYSASGPDHASRNFRIYYDTNGTTVDIVVLD